MVYMIIMITLACLIIGGATGYLIGRYVIGKWIASIVVEKIKEMM